MEERAVEIQLPVLVDGRSDAIFIEGALPVFEVRQHALEVVSLSVGQNGSHFLGDFADFRGQFSRLHVYIVLLYIAHVFKRHFLARSNQFP